MVLPASTVDCCLSSLRAGVCSLLWQWRISARVLMVACLPLLRVGWTAPSPVPLMLVASTGFPVNPGLFQTFLWVSFQRACAGFSCLALSVLVGVRSDFAPAVSPHFGFV